MMNIKTSRQLLQAMREIFQQGEHLLRALDEPAYRQRIPMAFNASIGGHYRHCLDHFLSIFSALQNGVLDYDDRKRDAGIEQNPLFAQCMTQDLMRRAKSLTKSDLESPILVRNKVSYAACDSPLVPSTVGREVMYAVTHAIHHYALISVMCGLQGVEVPEGFGVAPSTIKHKAAMESAAQEKAELARTEAPSVRLAA